MTQLKSILKEVSVDIAHQEVGRLELTRFEKMHVEVFESSAMASVVVAREMASLIRRKQSQGEQCVLGLATGSSPIKVYDELVRLHREEGLGFSNVITFNLDEYFPMQKNSAQSYYSFMQEHLFDHVDIPSENINIPDGTLAQEDVFDYCAKYESKIESYGGLDFQLLGIGRTGHIGFNEPGSHYNSLTRLVTLDYLTKADAASDFHGVDNVPKRAITMGIKTIKKAKRIVLLAWGNNKADIVKEAVEGQVTSAIPATFLQENSNTTVLLDEESCSELKRFKTPWLVGPVEWTEALKGKAIIWLSQFLGKSILKITDRDYNDNGMSDLLAMEGSAYKINIKMHNRLQHTITGWPGGKPNADDSNRPERAEPARKRVLIFSPHPDDDVISMGGTLLRLVDQGHEVHVAYQTSGNIAVADHDALRFIEFARYLNQSNGITNPKQEELLKEITTKNDADIDSVNIRKVKGLIRKGEALAAARYCGLVDDNIHFMDLPFYETGKSKKNPLSQEDIQITQALIEKVKPHQIYAAGDLADPHGTHKVCLDAVFQSLSNLKSAEYMKDCWVWLYRGAWHEWPVDEIEMAVPLSPDEVVKKRKAIFFHQSQKDGVMFQGEDSREFWQRVEDRNEETAKRYNQLGLTEYEAIEGFVRYNY
ncbi:MAG: glucosamine-6-phosphate deaminase [Cyclobacteriaceae bacterium]